MVEEAGGNQAAASKGSSPDMEEYEVIATELKNPTAEVGSEIHPEQDAHITSTTAESECKDSTWNLKILKKLTTGNAHELNKWRDTFTNYENKNGFPFYVRLGDSCLWTLDPATVSWSHRERFNKIPTLVVTGYLDSIPQFLLDKY